MLVNGSVGGNLFIFTPTGMDLNSTSGANTITSDALRTSSTCFMKGFSEKIRIQTSSGRPWFWRRIVIRAKNSAFTTLSTGDTSPVQSNGEFTSVFESVANGMQRLYFNLAINNVPATYGNVQSVLFKGQIGSDWVDVQTAAVDTARVDLVSDRRMTIRSGNESGTVKDYNMYYPYNHNLVYDDDENGGGKISSYFSVRDKKGHGDMHIIDFFQPGTGATASDILQLTSTSTMYWHEK